MTFKENGYTVVKNLIPKHDAISLGLSLNDNKPTNSFNGDDQVPNTPNFYKHLLITRKQSEVLSKIEDNTGLKLLKTYNYSRIYKKGDILRIHKDREECEISLTLDLGGDEWPIYILDKDENPVEIHLEPGDALIYRGCELSHWRSKFKGEKHPQAFMHFVDANGPYSHLEGDPKNK